MEELTRAASVLAERLNSLRARNQVAGDLIKGGLGPGEHLHVGYMLDTRTTSSIDGFARLNVVVTSWPALKRYERKALKANGWVRTHGGASPRWERLVESPADTLEVSARLIDILTQGFGVSSSDLVNHVRDEDGSLVGPFERHEVVFDPSQAPETDRQGRDEDAQDTAEVARMLREAFTQGGSDLLESGPGYVQWVDVPNKCMHVEASGGGPASDPMSEELVEELASAGWGRPDAHIRNCWFQFTEPSDIPAAAERIVRALNILADT